MKHSEQEKLLHEILTDDALSALREQSLVSGLATVRQVRQVRRLSQASVLLALSILLLLTFLLPHSRTGIPQHAALRTPHPALTPAPPESPKLKRITDEELIALFPDRDVALIGKPGHQQFVFLDRPRSTETDSQTE